VLPIVTIRLSQKVKDKIFEVNFVSTRYDAGKMRNNEKYVLSTGGEVNSPRTYFRVVGFNMSGGVGSPHVLYFLML
jgi:hypothetical protein